MLGIIGFLAAGIIFVAYANSLQARVKKVKGIRRDSLVAAYAWLGAACFLWAVGIALGNDFLQSSVIAGDVAVLASTALLADSVVAEQYRRPAVYGYALAAAAFIGLRVFWYLPNAAIINGVLVFNSPKVIAAVFGALILGAWLPLNLYIGRRLNVHYPAPMQSAYSLAFIVAALSTLLFLSSRHPGTLVVTFAALCCAFASLIGINMIGERLTHGK
jgi:hypothetical protein